MYPMGTLAHMPKIKKKPQEKPKPLVEPQSKPLTSSVPPGSADAKEFEKLVFDNLANKLTRPQILMTMKLENPWLKYRYEVYRESLKKAKQPENERVVFLQLATTSPAEITHITTHGVSVGMSFNDDLGDPAYGVYVYKFADSLPQPLFVNTPDAFRCVSRILACRVLKGRAHKVGLGSSFLEPSPGFGCHVPDVQKDDSTLSGPLKFRHQALYVYELNKDEDPVLTPSGILPVAVFDICYSKVPREPYVQDRPLRLPAYSTFTTDHITILGRRLRVGMQHIFYRGNENEQTQLKPHAMDPNIKCNRLIAWRSILDDKVFSELKNVFAIFTQQREVFINGWFISHALLHSKGFRNTEAASMEEINNFLVTNRLAVSDVNAASGVRTVIMPSSELTGILGVPSIINTLHMFTVSPSARYDATCRKAVVCPIRRVGPTNAEVIRTSTKHFLHLLDGEFNNHVVKEINMVAIRAYQDSQKAMKMPGTPLLRADPRKPRADPRIAANENRKRPADALAKSDKGNEVSSPETKVIPSKEISAPVTKIPRRDDQIAVKQEPFYPDALKSEDKTNVSSGGLLPPLDFKPLSRDPRVLAAASGAPRDPRISSLDPRLNTAPIIPTDPRLRNQSSGLPSHGTEKEISDRRNRKKLKDLPFPVLSTNIKQEPTQNDDANLLPFGVDQDQKPKVATLTSTPSHSDDELFAPASPEPVKPKESDVLPGKSTNYVNSLVMNSIYMAGANPSGDSNATPAEAETSHENSLEKFAAILSNLAKTTQIKTEQEPEEPILSAPASPNVKAPSAIPLVAESSVASASQDSDYRSFGDVDYRDNNFRRDVDYRPKQDMDYRPSRDVDYRPKQDVDYRPQKDVDYRNYHDVDYRPAQDVDYRPLQDVDYRPFQDSDFRQPPQDVDYRPLHLADPNQRRNLPPFRTHDPKLKMEYTQKILKVLSRNLDINPGVRHNPAVARQPSLLIPTKTSAPAPTVVSIPHETFSRLAPRKADAEISEPLSPDAQPASPDAANTAGNATVRTIPCGASEDDCPASPDALEDRSAGTSIKIIPDRAAVIPQDPPHGDMNPPLFRPSYPSYNHFMPDQRHVLIVPDRLFFTMDINLNPPYLEKILFAMLQRNKGPRKCALLVHSVVLNVVTERVAAGYPEDAASARKYADLLNHYESQQVVRMLPEHACDHTPRYNDAIADCCNHLKWMHKATTVIYLTDEHRSCKLGPNFYRSGFILDAPRQVFSQLQPSGAFYQ